MAFTRSDSLSTQQRGPRGDPADDFPQDRGPAPTPHQVPTDDDDRRTTDDYEMESEGIEPTFPACDASVFPLDHDPFTNHERNPRPPAGDTATCTAPGSIAPAAGVHWDVHDASALCANAPEGLRDARIVMFPAGLFGIEPNPPPLQGGAQTIYARDPRCTRLSEIDAKHATSTTRDSRTHVSRSARPGRTRPHRSASKGELRRTTVS